MKMTFILAIFFWFVGDAAVGQVPPPPPPPPTIYSAPETAEIRELRDEINNFRVSFPGNPEKKAETVERLTLVQYRVYRKGSNSYVTVTTFPREGWARDDELYESYKDRLAGLAERTFGRTQSSKWQFTFDREIKIGSTRGREFGYETDMHFIHAAVFARGNRFFEIRTDVTNWHILKRHYPEIVEAFTSETRRFIDSFAFLK